MHVVIVLFRFVTPMALAVVGDLLLHAVPCPGLIGSHLHAPIGHRLWLHARHGSYPPRATRSALAPRWQGDCAPDKADGASGLTGRAPCLLRRHAGGGEVPPGSPRGRQGLRWLSATRSRSLVAPDEIRPDEDVPRHGLQEVDFAPARWHGEDGVQGVQPEDVQMGGSWGRAGAAIADFAEVI